jgi:hypothetical protein
MNKFNEQCTHTKQSMNDNEIDLYYCHFCQKDVHLVCEECEHKGNPDCKYFLSPLLSYHLHCKEAPTAPPLPAVQYDTIKYGVNNLIFGGHFNRDISPSSLLCDTRYLFELEDKIFRKQ